MKNRIRIIFLLIITSIIGLIIIQGFWIIRFYSINQQQTHREIKLSLENSVKAEMNNRYAYQGGMLLPGVKSKPVYVLGDTVPTINLDSLFKIRKSKNKIIIGNKSIDDRADQSRKVDSIFFNKLSVSDAKLAKDNIEKYRKMDSIFKVMEGNGNIPPAEVSISYSNFGSSPYYIDSMPETVEIRVQELLGTILSAGNIRQPNIDLNMIDSLFQKEINHRGIEMDYYLEVYDNLSGTVVDKLREEFYNESGYDPVGVSATVFGDKEVRISSMRNLKSFFSPPVVKGSLQAALLLLILVVSSYFYMLKTIFDQKKLSTIKNDFINNMTHELKTPIATVSAIVESMQNFGVLEDKEKTNKYLDVSQKELGRLSGLVEKVLNMAREEREPLRMSPEELNIREICDNIINSQSIKQAEKSVSFDVKVEEEAEKVVADRFHMVNVMQNLIENSIKYSEDPVIIRIACERRKDFIKISVSDNGVGIPKKHQGKVFDQFYRVPTGDVHNVKGFGLGLHYVRNIVEKHDGKISLNSEVGKGSTFTINLSV